MRSFHRTMLIGVPLLTGFLWLASTSPATADGKMPIAPSRYTERPPVNEESLKAGKKTYERACIMCHGVAGKGDGPAAFFLSRDLGPRPRDFTQGAFKLRSTPSGQLPTDEDLFRTVTNGIPGFMPTFAGLDPADRWKVIYYIKSFHPEFEGAKPTPIEVVGHPVPSTGASVGRGYRMYQEAKCWECHGGGGKGNGEKAAELTDDSGLPLPPTDLTAPSSFKNGSRPEDLYRTIMTGLSGTPMPSYDAFFTGRESDLWDLINYISSLSEERRARQ